MRCWFQGNAQEALRGMRMAGMMAREEGKLDGKTRELEEKGERETMEEEET